jgi:serine/threonine-protein phosphatase CPPED1
MSQQQFTFAQVCDPQLGINGYQHDTATLRLAIEQLNRDQPEIVWFCGDLVHEHADPEGLADFQAIRAGLQVPSFCVPGNHDVGNEPTPRHLRRFRALFGPEQRAVEHKGVTFIGVNTPLWKAPLHGETEGQDDWFREELENAGSRPVFVVGHHPLFVERPNEDEHYFNLPHAQREKLLGWLRKFKVTAMLTGHTHRNTVHDLGGPLMVTSVSTSESRDASPLGYRLWHVHVDTATGELAQLSHTYKAIEGAEQIPRELPAQEEESAA